MMKRMICASALVLAFALSALAGTDASSMVGTWEGPLSNGMGGQIRVVLKVTQAADGLSATMDSPDQNASGIPVKTITLDGRKVSLDVTAVGGTYEGTLDAAKGEVSGTWHQNGQSLPLVLKKQASKEEPPKK